METNEFDEFSVLKHSELFRNNPKANSVLYIAQFGELDYGVG